MATVTSARAPIGVTLLRYGRSFGVGAAFAVGWTPCVGPVLAAILTLAASSGTVLHGAALLAFWSAGLGVPFLIAGLMVGRLVPALARLRPVMPVLEVAGGALVIVVGILIFLDRFTIFNQYFTGVADTVTTAEGSLDGISVAGPAGFAAAFVAGIIAFLSPCCLPLVPAYLAHLAGISVEGPTAELRPGVTFRHALSFVLGFSLLFVVLGASVGAAASLVRDNLPTIEKVAGVLLIVMGLNLMGVIRIPWLYRTYQIDFSPPVSPAR
jgi:cytochrome c biogenesis protein CcdA